MSLRKMIIPPYLKKGDTVGVVCPAGYMPFAKAQSCIDTLLKWGYKVKCGQTLGGKSDNYFSGNDEMRLLDLQQMIDDPEVSAILCGRGGYGTGRIIDELDLSRFRKKPKWIIGFSDITILHAHLHQQYQVASLHAPMAAAFNDGGNKGIYVRSLRNALEGQKATYKVKTHPYNILGKAQGPLVGGNLALVAHLIGTPSGFDTKGKILFLEDVGEQLYNIDRMLHQLRRSGMFKKLKGLIFGGFTECKDTDRPFGRGVLEILNENVKDLDIPVCFQFPVSHEKENFALKIGVSYSLDVSKKYVTLIES